MKEHGSNFDQATIRSKTFLYQNIYLILRNSLAIIGALYLWPCAISTLWLHKVIRFNCMSTLDDYIMENLYMYIYIKLFTIYIYIYISKIKLETVVDGNPFQYLLHRAIYIYIYIYVVPSIRFQTFFVQAFKIVVDLKIHDVIAIHLMR